MKRSQAKAIMALKSQRENGVAAKPEKSVSGGQRYQPGVFVARRFSSMAASRSRNGMRHQSRHRAALALSAAARGEAKLIMAV